MATQTQTVSGDRDIAPFRANQEVEPALAARLDHRVLELGRQLQTTLEVRELISLFAEGINQDINYRGLHFQNKAEDIEVSIGRRSAHKCTYRLTIEDNSLGELTLFSRAPFKDEELVILENILCALVYPLRNAMLYHSALQTALMDPLTGINNRAGMDTAIKREIELARRHKSSMCIMLLDIDHFKAINDNFGHACGDFVLQAVAQCMKETVRCSDMLFRFGGEEFLILLSCTEVEGARLLAERIRQKIETLTFGAHKDLKATASLGVTALRKNDTPETLFKRADAALYKAKKSGRNQVISK